jgi:hypothetical protein
VAGGSRQEFGVDNRRTQWLEANLMVEKRSRMSRRKTRKSEARGVFVEFVGVSNLASLH